MSENPYDPNFSPDSGFGFDRPGGGYDSHRVPGAGPPNAMPPSQAMGELRSTPIEDPYQDGFQLAVVSRKDYDAFKQFQGGEAASGAVRQSRLASGRTRLHPGPPQSASSKWAAVFCVGLVALLTLTGLSLLGLIVAVIFYGVSRSNFARAWASNSFNMLLTVIGCQIVVLIVEGVMKSNDMAMAAGLIGASANIIFSLIFVAGLVSALTNSYFRFPLQIPALR